MDSMLLNEISGSLWISWLYQIVESEAIFLAKMKKIKPPHTPTTLWTINALLKNITLLFLSKLKT